MEISWGYHGVPYVQIEPLDAHGMHGMSPEGLTQIRFTKFWSKRKRPAGRYNNWDNSEGLIQDTMANSLSEGGKSTTFGQGHGLRYFESSYCND